MKHLVTSYLPHKLRCVEVLAGTTKIVGTFLDFSQKILDVAELLKDDKPLYTKLVYNPWLLGLAHVVADGEHVMFNEELSLSAWDFYEQGKPIIFAMTSKQLFKHCRELCIKAAKLHAYVESRGSQCRGHNLYNNFLKDQAEVSAVDLYEHQATFLVDLVCSGVFDIGHSSTHDCHYIRYEKWWSADPYDQEAIEGLPEAHLMFMQYVAEQLDFELEIDELE